MSWAAATGLALSGAAASPASAQQGHRVQPSAATRPRQATVVSAYSGAAGRRSYRLYVPAGLKRPLGLIVFLHGCNETAAQAESSTHLDRIATAEHLVVAYPQQDTTDAFPAGNGAGCWNWFLPGDQQRGTGEPAILAGLTRAVVRDTSARADRVYVEGISAGADMAVILGATYPDIYAAVGALAGCAYGSCGDLRGTLTHAAMGPAARVVPLFQENGTADTVNNLAMAESLTSSWIAADQMASPSDGIEAAPTSIANHPGRLPRPGTGDPCVTDGQYTWGCPGGAIGFQGRYPTTVSTWRDRHGCDVYEKWLLHGMEHAQPDSDPSTDPYSDPLGPDISAASYRFFAAHSLHADNPGGCIR